MSTIVEFQRRYRRCECGDALNHNSPHAKPLRRQPEWIRRMNEGKLPNKDLTGKGPDAA